MEAKLSHASSLPQKDKGPVYVSLLTDVLARADPATVKSDVHKILEVVLQDNVVTGRTVLQELAKSLSDNTIQVPELRKEIVQDTLQVVQPRLVSYEEQVSFLT
jgi:COP9 signalosome complex subunit 4